MEGFGSIGLQILHWTLKASLQVKTSANKNKLSCVSPYPQHNICPTITVIIICTKYTYSHGNSNELPLSSTCWRLVLPYRELQCYILVPLGQIGYGVCRALVPPIRTPLYRFCQDFLNKPYCITSYGLRFAH